MYFCKTICVNEDQCSMVYICTLVKYNLKDLTSHKPLFGLQ